jgi:hypothetical protein
VLLERIIWSVAGSFYDLLNSINYQPRKLQKNLPELCCIFRAVSKAAAFLFRVEGFVEIARLTICSTA